MRDRGRKESDGEKEIILQQCMSWSLYRSLVGSIRCQCCVSKVVRWVCHRCRQGAMCIRCRWGDVVVIVWRSYTPPHSEEECGRGGGILIVSFGPFSSSCLSSCSWSSSHSNLCSPPFASHVSSALHSSSSSSFSQISPSSPSPHHHTKYCFLQPFHHSSTILSMKNSCWPSTFIGFGGCNVWEGKRESSFSWKGLTSDVWKMGNRRDCEGNARVTVEWVLSVAITGYGLSKHGMNLAMRGFPPVLYTCLLFAVDRTTLSPIAKGNDSCLCEFSWYACRTFTVSRLSFASSWIGCIYLIMLTAICCWLSFSACGLMMGSRTHADLPKRSWKGVNPVDVFIVFIMSNRTLGMVWTHPLWSCSTANLMAWMTVLFVLLLVPSDSGWYAIDIFSFIPVSLCSSFQKHDRKILSWSDMISRGRPFLQYQCWKKRSANCSVVIVVVVGTIHISDPSQSERDKTVVPLVHR